MEEIGRLDRGRLRIGTFSSAGASFVVDALRDLRRDSPGVVVSIAERGMPSAAVRGVRDCDLDLAVTFDYPDAGEVLGGDGLEVHPLLDDPADVVLPRTHRLAGRKRVTFADLADEDWLLPDFGPDSPSLRLINRGCVAAGFEPRIAFRINDCQMTQALVAGGEGIAMLPRLTLRPAHPGVCLKQLDGSPPLRRIVVVRHASRYLSPAVARFLELLQAAAPRYASVYSGEGR